MTDDILTHRTHREQLQQIIVGLTEGVILVNPDETIAWANQAALAMHGIKTLKDLGTTVAGYRKQFMLQYRNHRRLAAGEYPLDRLAAGEAFDELIVEVPQPAGGNSWVYQTRGLVLRGQEGQPICLVLILEDLTEQYSAEDRFERTFGANPAPAIIVRLSDMRYVKVNQGFLELTGFQRDGLIGKSLHEIDVIEGAEKRELAVKHLHAGLTIPQMHAHLRVADGTTRFVIVAGQPIEVGDAACMLFSFADLHPRQQAEEALRRSEARFSLAFRMAPGPMVIIALDGLRLLDVNDAFTAATGWRREEIIGLAESELGLWGAGAAHDELARLVDHTGRLRSVEVELHCKDGSIGDYLLSAETVDIHGEPCLLTVMLDITERKRTEVELLAAVAAVMKDTSWFGQQIVEKFANITHSRKTPQSGPELAELTPRVREVLGLVAEGLSDQEIAATLNVSRNTVRNHVTVIYKKLGMNRRSAVVVWARERGLVAPKKTKPKQQPKSGRPRKARTA